MLPFHQKLSSLLSQGCRSWNSFDVMEAASADECNKVMLNRAKVHKVTRQNVRATSILIEVKATPQSKAATVLLQVAQCLESAIRSCNQVHRTCVKQVHLLHQNAIAIDFCTAPAHQAWASHTHLPISGFSPLRAARAEPLTMGMSSPGNL